MKKILCVHAHSSNIDYLEKMLGDFPCFLQHEVIKSTTDDINSDFLRDKISTFFTTDTIACFLTCTVHSSLLTEEKLQGIPIFKIEEPLLEKILKDTQEEKLFLFTNPNTVDLTIKKLNYFKDQKSLQQSYEVKIIPKAFELILSDKKEAYKTTILTYLEEIPQPVYLMQLSMSVIENDSLIADKNITTVYKEARSYFRKVIAQLLNNDVLH